MKNGILSWPVDPYHFQYTQYDVFICLHIHMYMYVYVYTYIYAYRIQVTYTIIYMYVYLRHYQKMKNGILSRPVDHITINIVSIIIIINCIERAETERKLIKYDDIEVCELDLSDLQSVRNFALLWGSKPLHVLACNAGTFM
jgi:hypothetical protein